MLHLARTSGSVAEARGCALLRNAARTGELSRHATVKEVIEKAWKKERESAEA